MVFKVRHTGPYRHLGNAWAAGYSYARAKVFAENKNGPHFEIYESDRAQVPEDEVVNELYLPIKGSGARRGPRFIAPTQIHIAVCTGARTCAIDVHLCVNLISY